MRALERRNGIHKVDETPAEQVDAIVRASTDWRGETLSLLRSLIMNAAPSIVEEVKWRKPSRPEGVPVWSRDGIVCTGEMLKNAVRLTFPKGAHINDPSTLFNARMDSGTVRAIDFHEGDQPDESGLKAIIAEAAELNVESSPAKGASDGRTHEPSTAVSERTASATPLHRAGATGSIPGDRERLASSRDVPGGTVHPLPPDLRTALVASPAALAAWLDITPLARNEFICWVDDAKQEITRERRIRRTGEELEEGQRRPCCWPGCRHRERHKAR